MQAFGPWVQQVDEKQIDTIYDKARISVELVRMYDANILHNISTIANLASGAYGIYSSGENLDILPPSDEQKLVVMGQGRVIKQQLKDPKYQRQIIKQYYPNLDTRKLKHGDTIHVNVHRIMQQSKSDYETILQIASTIIHESTHDNEYRQTGHTSEAGPEAAERRFMIWARTPTIQKHIIDRIAQFKGFSAPVSSGVVGQVLPR